MIKFLIFCGLFWVFLFFIARNTFFKKIRGILLLWLVFLIASSIFIGEYIPPLFRFLVFGVRGIRWQGDYRYRISETSSQISFAKENLKEIAIALNAFKKDIGRYPTEKEGLVVLVSNDKKIHGWNGPYLKPPSVTHVDMRVRPNVYDFPGLDPSFIPFVYENTDNLRVIDKDKNRNYSVVVDKGVVVWSLWLKKAQEKMKIIKTTEKIITASFILINILFLLLLIIRVRGNLGSIGRIRGWLINGGLGIVGNIVLFFHLYSLYATCYIPLIDYVPSKRLHSYYPKHYKELRDHLIKKYHEKGVITERVFEILKEK